MLFFVPFSAAMFLLAFLAGAKSPKWPGWKYTDLVYYPLAAIGVILLFLSNDAQRKLIQTTWRASADRSSLQQLKNQRPLKLSQVTPEILEAYLRHIRLVDDWAQICQDTISASVRTDPRCLAASDLAPVVASFINAASRNYPSFEDKLLATCSAGERLLISVRDGVGMSSFVGGRVYLAYAERADNGAGYGDGERADYVRSFQDKTKSELDLVMNQIGAIDPEAKVLYSGILNAEVEYGGWILRGISPCTFAPPNKLKAALGWRSHVLTKEQQLIGLEKSLEALRKPPPRTDAFAYIQISFWPCVIIIALAMKFAKGVAALRSK
jgi:hypothetical protein